MGQIFKNYLRAHKWVFQRAGQAGYLLTLFATQRLIRYLYLFTIYPSPTHNPSHTED